MAASVKDISDWFDFGVSIEATHMIVVCDDFDYEDYPVYVEECEDARQKAHEMDTRNMQRVMEVYSLRKSKVTQIVANYRTFDYD